MRLGKVLFVMEQSYGINAHASLLQSISQKRINDVSLFREYKVHDDGGDMMADAPPAKKIMFVCANIPQLACQDCGSRVQPCIDQLTLCIVPL